MTDRYANRHCPARWSDRQHSVYLRAFGEAFYKGKADNSDQAFLGRCHEAGVRAVARMKKVR